MFHLLSDRVIRGPHGTGCGRGQTRESLNEVRSHVSHLCALGDQFLEHVIPTDGQSLIVLDDLIGRSFWLLMIYLSSFDQMKVCQFLVHVIPKDGQSLIVQDDLSGRSFLLRGQMSFCLRKVCQMKVDQFLVHVIPMDGQNGQLAYARLLNQNRVILNYGRYKKVCLTSSFFPGGRRLVLRCVAYLTTRALVRGRLILEHRRSFWCRALRGHRLCDEACDLLQF
jgi:hypothetical protein